MQTKSADRTIASPPLSALEGRIIQTAGLNGELSVGMDAGGSEALPRSGKPIK
jgi:hypothetical protein